MALSEQEQRLLDEMERSLYQGDADFMSTAPSGQGGISARSITIAVLAVAVGLGIVVTGLAINQPLIGLLGFIVTVAGIAWALRGNGSANGAAADSAPRKQTSSAQRPKQSDYMSRLEERWDERRRGDL